VLELDLHFCNLPRKNKDKKGVEISLFERQKYHAEQKEIAPSDKEMNFPKVEQLTNEIFNPCSFRRFTCLSCNLAVLKQTIN